MPNGILSRIGGLFGRFVGRASQEAAGTAAGFAASTAFEPIFRASQQELNRRFPNQVLSPADVVALVRRNLHDDLDATDEMQATGLDAKRRRLLFALTRRFPDVEVLLEGLRRGLVDEALVRDRLHRLGFDGDDQDVIVELAEQLPGLSDIIRFAVREVFSPDQRQALDLDAEFPEQFLAEARRRGLSEENARNVWASHWELPSLTAAFEMFQRRVPSGDGRPTGRHIIERSDLEGLIRAQDFAPVWRDRLTQIAYNPATRVDIRRFHRLGLVPEEELPLWYEENGFSPETAKFMARFTVAMNTEDERGLTRFLIQRAHELGVIDRREALDQLEEIGHSREHAVLILSLVDAAEDQRLKDEELRVIRARVVAGDLTAEEAERLLARADVSPDRANQLATSWAFQAAANVDRLPRTTLAQLFREGIIEEETFREELARLRIPERQIEWLVQLAVGQAAEE